MAATKKTRGKAQTVTMIAVVRVQGGAKIISADVPITTRLKVEETGVKDLPVTLNHAMAILERMAGVRT